MRDYDDQQLLKRRTDPVSVSLINSLCQHIDEHVGGILCMAHYCLPECNSTYSGGRWIVKVTTCCQENLKQVEQRLETFCEGH